MARPSVWTVPDRGIESFSFVRLGRLIPGTQGRTRKLFFPCPGIFCIDIPQISPRAPFPPQRVRARKSRPQKRETDRALPFGWESVRNPEFTFEPATFSPRHFRLGGTDQDGRPFWETRSFAAVKPYFPTTNPIPQRPKMEM